MNYKIFIRTVLMTLAVVMSALTVSAQDNISRDYSDDDNNYSDRVRIDRYLDVELWTNHSDDEFYEGDNIVIYYRANQDAFIAIYTIDTRGRVNLLFPTEPTDDNYVRGGATYSLPGGSDNFDLEVNGPEGVENIQVIASRDKFPIPDWYNHSGMVCDWDDRYEFMDYLNEKYFVRYDGQRFAYDRVAIFVDEWEPDYYRPTYWPSYPDWSVCGNVYIDYPWGGTVYVNGVYWGCAPLYIPRLLVGWHTITIYDPWGYCWESDFHVSRYNTIVFDHTIVQTKTHVISKYKDSNLGYKNPTANGYPNFKEHVLASNKTTVKNNVTINNNVTVDKTNNNVEVSSTLKKNYLRGSTKLVKSERGFESDNVSSDTQKSQSRTTRGSLNKNSSSEQKTSDSYNGTKTSVSRTSKVDKSSVNESTGKSTSSDNSYEARETKSSNDSESSYYRKKSGTSTKSERTTTTTRVEKNTQKKSSDNTSSSKINRTSDNSSKSSRSTTSTVTKSPAQKSTPSKSTSSGSSSTSKTTTSSKEKKTR